MLRNYVTELSLSMDTPVEGRAFLEDTAVDLYPSSAQLNQSSQGLVEYIGKRDPMVYSRGQALPDMNDMLNIYSDRVFQRYLDIKNPEPDEARSQVSRLLEGLHKATDAVKARPGAFRDALSREVKDSLLDGTILTREMPQLGQDEARDSGTTSMLQSRDNTGAAFLDYTGKAQLITQHLTDDNVRRLAKTSWKIWERLAKLNRSDSSFTVPSFARATFQGGAQDARASYAQSKQSGGRRAFGPAGKVRALESRDPAEGGEKRAEVDCTGRRDRAI